MRQHGSEASCAERTSVTMIGAAASGGGGAAGGGRHGWWALADYCRTSLEYMSCHVSCTRVRTAGNGPRGASGMRRM